MAQLIRLPSVLAVTLLCFSPWVSAQSFMTLTTASASKPSITSTVHTPRNVRRDHTSNDRITAATSTAPPISTITPPAPITDLRDCTAKGRAIATQTIRVGGIEHKFTPEEVLACKDDVIKFEFFPKNHSVVRAAYDAPCVPYNVSGANEVGFFSGFYTTDKFTNLDPSSWFLKVNSTDPVFFYCSAPGSCKDHAMVGAINPRGDTPLDAHKEKARRADYQLSPGEPIPDEVSSTPSSTSKPVAKDHPHGLSKGAIAGIVVGISVGVILAAGLFFYMGRAKSLKESMERTSATVTSPHTRQSSHASYAFPAARFSELPAQNIVPPTYAQPAASESPKSPDRYFSGFSQLQNIMNMAVELEGSHANQPYSIPTNPPPPPPPPVQLKDSPRRVPLVELWAPVPEKHGNMI